jgi:hypothetical protein
MTRILRTALLGATLAVLVPTAAVAADHSGSVTADSAAFTWDGGPLNGALSTTDVYENVPCDAPGNDCDDTLINVLVPAGHTAQGTVTIAGGTDNDLDLFLYRSDASGKVGDPIQDSAGPDANESLTFDADPGYYLIRVVAATATDATYKGTVKIVSRPVPGEVNYGVDPADPGAGGQNGLGPTSLANDLAPTTIAKPPASSQSRLLRGTARDRDGKVAYVDVGLVQVRKSGCRTLRPNGTWVRIRKCSVPTFIRAKGTTRWSLKLRKRLAKGTYVVFSRATDNLGRREGGFNRRNRIRFVVK